MTNSSGSTPTRPTLAARVCRRIVRLYPAAWRRRYEDEVLEIVEQGRSEWRDCGDVARGAVTEWVSPARQTVGEEDDMRSRTARLVIAVGKAFVVLCAMTIGIRLAFGIMRVTFLAVARPALLQSDFASLLSILGRIVQIDHLGAFLIQSAAFFGYALLGGAPIALAMVWSGVGRRWPVVARVVSVAGFLWLNIWLVHIPEVSVPMLMAGWALFAAVFPRVPRSTSARPTPVPAIPA
jgi:hypothetical protein